MKEIRAKQSLAIEGYTGMGDEIDALKTKYIALWSEGLRPGDTELDTTKARFDELTSSAVQFQDALNLIPPLAKQIGQALMEMAQSFSKSVGDSVAQILVYHQKTAVALKNLLKSVAAQIVSTLVSLAIQWVIYQIIGKAVAGSMAASHIGGSAGAAGAAAYASVWETVGWPVALALAPAMAALATTSALAFGEAGIAAGKGVGITAAAAHGGLFTGRAPFMIAEAGQPEIALTERNVREFLGVGRSQEISIYLDSEVITRRVVQGMPRELALYGITM
jgi:hypothetical protein